MQLLNIEYNNRVQLEYEIIPGIPRAISRRAAARLSIAGIWPSSLRLDLSADPGQMEITLTKQHVDIFL